MNVSEQDHKILDAVNGLTPKPILKEMTIALIFLVEIMSIGHTYPFYDIA